MLSSPNPAGLGLLRGDEPGLALRRAKLASQGCQGCQTANNEQRSHRREKIHVIKSRAGEGDKWWHNRTKCARTRARLVNGAPVMRGAQESRAWGSEAEGTPQSSWSPCISVTRRLRSRLGWLPLGPGSLTPLSRLGGSWPGCAEGTGTLQGLVCQQRWNCDSSL